MLESRGDSVYSVWSGNVDWMLLGGSKSTMSEQAWCAGADALNKAAFLHLAEMGLKDQIPAPEAIKLQIGAAGCATEEELRAAAFWWPACAAASSGGGNNVSW